MRIPFAERHKQIRLRCGYTQEQLADVLGISRLTISSWEIGKVSAPETDMLLRLSDLYLASVDWLLGNPYADMLHPTARAARDRLRAHLKDVARFGVPSVKAAVHFLMTEYPDLFTVSFMCRRLHVDSVQLREGDMHRTSVDGLVELTGIPLDFWQTGDPALLDTPPIDSETARLHHELASQGISVDLVHDEMPYLRDIAEKKTKKG